MNNKIGKPPKAAIYWSVVSISGTFVVFNLEKVHAINLLGYILFVVGYFMSTMHCRHNCSIMWPLKVVGVGLIISIIISTILT
jgi:hypothetical protein